jgi:hypothetical protein
MLLSLHATVPTARRVLKRPVQQRAARALVGEAIPFQLHNRCRLLDLVHIVRKSVRTKANLCALPSRTRDQRRAPPIHQHAGCIRVQCRHESNPIVPVRISRDPSASRRFLSTWVEPGQPFLPARPATSLVRGIAAQPRRPLHPGDDWADRTEPCNRSLGSSTEVANGTPHDLRFHLEHGYDDPRRGSVVSGNGCGTKEVLLV